MPCSALAGAATPGKEHECPSQEKSAIVGFRDAFAEQRTNERMSTTRVIRKYPNRRLYDTEESRYITLADVRDLVINRVDFTIIDKKSGDDITRSILLQVISEQEAHGEAIMSRDFLSRVIRAYGTVMPSVMGRYLEQSIAVFVSQQHAFRGQVERLAGADRFAGNTGAAPAAGDANKTATDPVAEKPEDRAKTDY